MCSKSTEEHPYRSVISVKLLFEITVWRRCSPVNLMHIFRTPFPKNTSGRLLLNRYLHVRIQQWKHQEIMWVLFKVNKKYFRTKSYGTFIFDFDEVNDDWEYTLRDVCIALHFFFSMWFFFHEHSRITGLQGKGEDTKTLAGWLLHRAQFCT